MSTAESGECHGVTGIPRLVFPWRYTETLTTGGSLALLDVTRTNLVEWWWRFQSLNAEVQLTAPALAPYSSVPSSPANITLTRRYSAGGTAMATDAERELMAPGADCTEPATAPSYFDGSTTLSNWAGGGSTLTISVRVGLCTLGDPAAGNPYFAGDLTAAEKETRAWYRVADDKWFPTLWVMVTVQGDTPGVSFNAYLVTFPADRAEDFTSSTDADVFPAHGGGSLTMYGHDIDGVGFTDATVTIDPYSWFEYRDADGLNPCWSASTGAAQPGGHIRDPL